MQQKIENGCCYWLVRRIRTHLKEMFNSLLSFSISCALNSLDIIHPFQCYLKAAGSSRCVHNQLHQHCRCFENILCMKISTIERQTVFKMYWFFPSIHGVNLSRVGSLLKRSSLVAGIRRRIETKCISAVQPRPVASPHKTAIFSYLG